MELRHHIGNRLATMIIQRRGLHAFGTLATVFIIIGVTNHYLFGNLGLHLRFVINFAIGFALGATVTGLICNSPVWKQATRFD